MNETLKRSISGVIYISLLVAAIQYSTETFIILFGVFLLIAVFEFCELINLKILFPVLLATFLYSLFYVIDFNRNYDLLLLAATLFVSIQLILFLFSKKNNFIDLTSKYIYLLGYIIFPFIIITKLPFGIQGYNSKIIISIFLLIWTNDTFAYIVGKSIGRNKLLERVSPKKTIEGFLGGIVFTILASLLISEYYIGGAKGIWIGIAFIIGLFGTIGDLIESKFKRIAGVKDSGKIMPGHGGVLDRLDSVIFVAPFIYLFYQILYYVS